MLSVQEFLTADKLRWTPMKNTDKDCVLSSSSAFILSIGG
jgi:hypothetical protein